MDNTTEVQNKLTAVPKSVDSKEVAGGLLNFDEIIAAEDLTYQDIPVPEWGDGRSIRLQVLSAGEAIRFSQQMRDPAKKDDAIARIVMLCAVNPDGTRMMTEEKHLTLFKKKSIVVVQRLQKAALKLNGFIDEEGNPTDSKKREEEAKND